MYDASNPFLRGNFAPWREEGDSHDLEVVGELPRELNGSLYRIGPNPQYPPLGAYHWFDGDGMIHSFNLRDGRASYRSRYVRTAGLLAEMKAGRALYGGLLNLPQDLPKDLPADIPMEGGPFKNAANTNIIGYSQRLLALWEGGLPHELKPGSLETVGPFNFRGKLNGPMTAHPKFDPETGQLLFFGYQPFPPFVTFHRADLSGNLVESRPIDTGLPVMMHDFVTTRNHVVFFVCPSVFRLENLQKGLPVLNWEPRHGTRIGVMNRVSGELRWFDHEACYIFHFLNGYEDGESIVVDACRMERLDMSGNDFGSPSIAHRYTLDLKSGKTQMQQIDEQPGDFPRIDDRLNGLKHRYGYFAGARLNRGKLTGSFEVLIKRDYQTGHAESLDLGPHMSPGEPVFVPRHAGSAENDGFALSVWFDAEQNRSEMVVADAANFSSEPLARVKLQHRVPYGFHGNWVDAQASEASISGQAAHAAEARINA